MEFDLIAFFFIGFIAQLVDSALGMGFGSLSSSLLLSMGIAPQSLISVVHLTEVFGGGVATASHWRFKNVDLNLLKNIMLPAVFGPGVGAMIAAPIGALLCKKIPAKPLMFCVGFVIITVGIKTVLTYWGII